MSMTDPSSKAPDNRDTKKVHSRVETGDLRCRGLPELKPYEEVIADFVLFYFSSDFFNQGILAPGSALKCQCELAASLWTLVVITQMVRLGSTVFLDSSLWEHPANSKFTSLFHKRSLRYACHTTIVNTST